MTLREEELVSWLLQGMGNKEIAGRMKISVRSVKGMLNRLFLKYGINDPLKIKRVAFAVMMYKERNP